MKSPDWCEYSYENNIHGKDKNNSVHNLFTTRKIKYKRAQSLSGNHFQRNGALHRIRSLNIGGSDIVV